MNNYLKLYYVVCVIFLLCTIGCNTESDDDLKEQQEIAIQEDHSQTDTIPEPNRSNADSVNLLTNGGLEEWTRLWTPEMPKGWSLPSNEYVKQNRDIIYEGKSSAKMQSAESGKTARLEQVVQVSPNQKIRIRFRYYVEKWKSKGARTYCYFRTREAEVSNISANELQSFYDKNTYYIIRGGGYGKTYFSNTSSGWQTFDEVIMVPPTATYFAFGINSYYGTILYVDDCWVTNVLE